jgi:hypothetical protein
VSGCAGICSDRFLSIAEQFIRLIEHSGENSAHIASMA